jgi:hypothetical protein
VIHNALFGGPFFSLLSHTKTANKARSTEPQNGTDMSLAPLPRPPLTQLHDDDEGNFFKLFFGSRCPSSLAAATGRLPPPPPPPPPPLLLLRRRRLFEKKHDLASFAALMRAIHLPFLLILHLLLLLILLPPPASSRPYASRCIWPQIEELQVRVSLSLKTVQFLNSIPFFSAIAPRSDA